MGNDGVLESCLREGFIDDSVQADQRYVPQVLVNNKERKVKVLDTLLTQLEQCDEFFFSVAFITKSGIACLKDALLSVAQRHVKGKILASQYLNFTEPAALRELLKVPNVELRIVTEDHGFHAKGYLFHLPNASEENYTMVVGSSNLTASALTVNQEWNVFFTSSKDGALIKQMMQEFLYLWDDADGVTEDWIHAYESIYKQTNTQRGAQIIPFKKIQPNTMQVKALEGIESLRQKGAKRGLLISATGTGKTYLSAFDVKRCQPKRFLFIVHREMIAKAAKTSYERVWVQPNEAGLLTGHDKDIHKKYLFATIQTLAQDNILHQFSRYTFDYIVTDEVHRAGADSYQKVFSYFEPNFWLGMTATPERSDDFDIYAVFDHHIAYEIRLQDALAENMLVPFHYHGISEIKIDDQLLTDTSSFAHLTCDERVKHILYYATYYGSDGERVKGLVFTSSVDEAAVLAEKFREQGKRAIALSGSSTEIEREDAVKRLEADTQENSDYIEYIFTRDIFNEGVDIPEVNQIIMLRPTQSVIVFVQQLGRGLRKARHKRYVEVLDFIGNYNMNFLLPIALYGDRTYNKETVRRLINDNFLPGAASVHFDDITRQQIFDTINKRKHLAQAKELQESYLSLKGKLGCQPWMMDFVRFGDKDPYLFVLKRDSYYAFIHYYDSDIPVIPDLCQCVLAFVSKEIANGKRLEEVLVLKQLLVQEQVSIDVLAPEIQQKYGYIVEIETWAGVANMLSLSFFKKDIREKYGNTPLVRFDGQQFKRSAEFAALLKEPVFLKFLADVLSYGICAFDERFRTNPQGFCQGFTLYCRYSRKDVSRILNYDINRESTLYGYKVIGHTCPIFITYQKRSDINETTKYNDQFLSPQRFSWMTRSKLTLQSDEVKKIINIAQRKLLFVKKSDAEGTDFYYVGDVSIQGEPIETTIKNDVGKELPIVNFQFLLAHPVEESLYAYLNEKGN